MQCIILPALIGKQLFAFLYLKTAEKDAPFFFYNVICVNDLIISYLSQIFVVVVVRLSQVSVRKHFISSP